MQFKKQLFLYGMLLVSSVAMASTDLAYNQHSRRSSRSARSGMQMSRSRMGQSRRSGRSAASMHQRQKPATRMSSRNGAAKRMGSARKGPSRMSPRRSGSRTFGPGRKGPGRMAPGRKGPGRIGPRPGPRKFGPGRKGPGRMGPGRKGPGRIGPRPGSRKFGPGRIGPRRFGPGRFSRRMFPNFPRPRPWRWKHRRPSARYWAGYWHGWDKWYWRHHRYPVHFNWLIYTGAAIPATALIINNVGADSYYVCQGFYDGGVYPGKLSGRVCYVPHNGQSVVLDQYRILTGSGFYWVKASDGDAPENAVAGGYDKEGTPLYVCRVRYQGIKHPGYMVGDSCVFTWNNEELAANVYEVLASSNQ